MSFRDTQIVISRQSVLLVTGVGVGLLTLAYVLGVQVGKQSAALRRPATPSVEDELKALPEPLLDQLKIFETTDGVALEPRPKVEVPAPEPEKKAETAPTQDPKPAPAPAKADAKVPKVDPKPSDSKSSDPRPAKVEPLLASAKAKPETKEVGGKWNLQLVATPDPKEADRVAAKAKAAGYATTLVKDHKLLKVRLAKPLPRADADIATTKLKEKGLKPYATKAD